MTQITTPTATVKPIRGHLRSKTAVAQEDLQLLDRLLEKDPQAWPDFLQRFRPLILRCVQRILVKFSSVVCSEAEEEVLSQVYLNLLRHDMRKLRAFDPNRGTKLSSWIGLISVNTTYEYLRQCARQPLLDQIDGCPEQADRGKSPLDQLLDREAWRRMLRLTQDLSARDQDFMRLYFGHGLSPEEVARRMQISVKTVYSKKNKIRKRLRTLAAGEGQGAARLAA